ncbi:MAG: AAA-like domain-containing protein [Rivularia sp. (in: cyanobacteria)]
MGKTSLMHRILKHAERTNNKIVYLNLLQAEEKVLKELDIFLRWFCANISWRLGIENQVDNFWKQNFGGSNLNCTAYFEEYLFTKLDSSSLVVLGLDNVDQLFAYKSVAGDFFKLLRSWHEDAKFLDKWKKFRLVIAHSTEVYIPLDINSSPFGNVGLVINLQEFSFEQVKNLVQQYDLDWEDDQIDRLMKMIGGHPYLVQTALAHLKANPSKKLEEFLEIAPTEEGIYVKHLREHLLTLKKGSQKEDSNLEKAMKQVVESKEPVRLNSQQVFKLESLGLVTVQGDNVKPRCQLYRSYFLNHLQKDSSSTQ